jgi:hypothetical protein
MIVIRVELWPGGDRDRARSLGFASITNDGSGTDTSRNYDITVYSGGKPRKMKSGRLENWNSKKVSAWRTVLAALNKAFE